MPLFEYKCTNCGKISEFILKAGDAPMEGCKFCGERRLERILFSTFAVGAGDPSASCDKKHICGSSCRHGSKCGL
jgi:putative FmdB family regulatory protein